MVDKQMKKIDKYQFSTKDILGKGAFGEVFRGAHEVTGQLVAVKMISKKMIQADEYLMNGLLQEINIMKKLQSPNIVQLVDVFETGNNYYILQELCDSGDFRHQLKQQKILRESEAIRVLIDILSGFVELLKHGVIHRDLKPENILIHLGVYKLADFGFAKSVDNMNKELLQSLVGTPLYMSPQILKHEKYTTKSDIWSIGMIFYEMLYGQIPWTARSQYELVTNIDTKPVKFPENISLSNNAKDFIQKCLTIDEEKRITWGQIYEHPLFNNFFAKSVKNSEELENTSIFIANSIRDTIMKNRIDLETLFKSGGYENNSNQELDINQFTSLMLKIDPSIGRWESEYIFNKIDNDGNQSIDFQEFKKWLEQNNVVINLGSQINDAYNNRRQTIQENQEQMILLKQLSQNQEEKLDKIIQKLTYSIAKYKLNIKKLFEKFDSSGDKQLDIVEFSALIKRIDKELTDYEIKMVFDKFDEDKGGTIDFNEFQALLEKYKHILTQNQQNQQQIVQRMVDQQINSQGYNQQPQQNQNMPNQQQYGMQDQQYQQQNPNMQQNMQYNQQQANQHNQQFNSNQQNMQYQQQNYYNQQQYNQQPMYNYYQPNMNQGNMQGMNPNNNNNAMPMMLPKKGNNGNNQN